MIRRRLALSAAALILGLERGAFASEAGTLFDEAVKLLDAGRYAEACPKLERSQELEPAAGTLLNLAACYEKSGRRAAALRTFREASKAARARGRADWQKIADDHARDLDATVPKVTLRSAGPGPLQITVDHEPADLATPVPVEPGAHVVVVVKRAGYKPWSTNLTVRESVWVTIPALEPDKPAGTTGPTKPPERADDGGTRRTVGLALVGVGAAGVVFGVVSGLVANGALSDAKEKCPSYPDRCAPAAQAPNDRAETWSTLSTVGFVAGGVIAAGGVVLYLWPGSPITVGTTGTELRVGGRF